MQLFTFAHFKHFIVLSTSLPLTMLHERAARHPAPPGRLLGLCRNTLNLVPAAWLPTCRSVAIDTRWHWQGLLRACAQERLRCTACNLDKERKWFFKKRAYLVYLGWAFQNYLSTKALWSFFIISQREKKISCFVLFTTSCTMLKHPDEIMQCTSTGNTLPLALF